MPFYVTAKAQHSATPDGACFYCHQPIGTEHLADCAKIHKKVKVRLTADYEINVPAHWNKENVEFHRNEGSWCATNAIEELERLATLEGCLCHVITFTCLSDEGEPFLEEE